MKVLVTGSGGFIGCNLCLCLLKKGHEVVASYRTEMPRVPVAFGPNLTLTRGDLTDPSYPDTLRGLGIDAVVNAAIVTSPAGAEKEYFARMARVNIDTTINLLEFAMREGVKNYVYASSVGVYGLSRGRGEFIYEDGPLDLYSTYSITKRTCELLAARFGVLAGAKAVSARIAAPYGPCERETPSRTVLGTVYGMVTAAAENRRITVWGKNIERDWTYVEDTVEGIRLLLEAPAEDLRHTEYNVSYGRPYTNEDVALAVKKACPSFGFEFVDDPAGADVSVFPPADRGIADIGRLQADTGFQPAFPLEKGVEKYLEYVRAQS